MKNKIISVILSLAVVLSMLVVPTAFAESKDYSNDIAVMQSLDMFSAVDATNSENLVTRGEFAALVDLLLNIDASNMKQVWFEDVDENHQYFEYISAAANAGIIQGTDGKYYPDRVIKYAEAAAILVNALGGKPAAEYESAYAGGYLRLADDLGIKEGVVAAANTEINVGMAARLLLNTGKAQIFTPLFSSDVVKIEKGSTLFWAKHKISSGKGVLTANEFTSIDDGPAAKADSVRIGTEFGGKIYYNSKVNTCLGQSVEYYFREENDENIIYYLEPIEGKNEIRTTTETEFNPESNILLYTINGKDKKISVKPETVVLYNGVRTFQYYIGENNDECIFDIVNGEMQLIDNNADGKIDVISITAFDDYFVSGVNVNDGIVYDAYGLANLDFGDAESDGRDWVITDEKGNIIDYTELKEKDIVSVAKSLDGNILRGVLSTKKVKANITKKYTDEGVLYVHIGDTKYEMLINEKLKKDRLAKIAELTAAGIENPVVTYGDVLPANGTNVTAYIGFMGKISAIETGRTLSGYGFVIRKHYDDSEEKYSLRILTQDGKKDKIPLATTVRIDGEAYREKDGSLNTYMSTFTDYQMVLYKLNGDEEITMIDTVASNKNDSNDVLRALNTTVEKNTYFNTQNSLYGKYTFTDEVVGFKTPANDPSIKYDLTLYSVSGKPSGFGSEYTYRVYTSQKDSFLTECIQIVTGGASDSYSRGSNDMLVSSVIETLDEDDLPVLQFKGYRNGTEVTYNLAADYEFSGTDANGAIDAHTVVPGDFIKFTTNAKSEISYVVPIKKMGTPEALGKFAADYTGTEMKGWFSTLDFYLFSGYLQSREGNYLGVVKHDTQLSESFVQPDGIFMVQDMTPIYYVTKRGSEGMVKKYAKADIGVMGTYQNNRVKGEVFCVLRNANLEMVIYYEQ